MQFVTLASNILSYKSIGQGKKGKDKHIERNCQKAKITLSNKKTREQPSRDSTIWY